ncbi:MAG: DnaD domain protein [Clostridia bacterium]
MQFNFKRNENLLLTTPVSNRFLVEYMPGAPERYVKVYLYGLMCCCAPALNTDIASALSMPESEVGKAFSYWQTQGLISVTATTPPYIEYAVIKDGAACTLRHNAPLVDALQNVLGTRMLSGAELQRMYDWIDVFGMEEAAAIMLVQYCVSLKGARVSMAYMDAVAKNWADSGVLSAEAAEEYIAGYEQMHSAAQSIKKGWSKKPPTRDELDMYKRWQEWGFDNEAILSACAQMAGINDPSFKYLNSILESWKISGRSNTTQINEYLKRRDAAAELGRMLFARAGLQRKHTESELEQIIRWKDIWHMDTEIMLLAAEQAKDASSPFPVLRKYIEAWHVGGIDSVSAAKKTFAHKEAAGAKKPRSLQYPQRGYSADELKKLGIDLLDEEK